MVEEPEGDGIFLHPGGYNLPGVADVRLRSNTIRGVGRHGIFAAGARIMVEQNAIADCPESGIYVAGDVTVLRNTITNARPGILVDGDHPGQIRQNLLVNSYAVRILDNNMRGVTGNTVR
jgi:hypothetical protein